MNFKKIAKITGISLVSLLALLIVLPFAFKGKIVSAVKEAANNNLNAKVSFNDDISLSLLRNFPNLSLGIQDVKVVGVDSFAQDTLIDAKNIRLVLDLASVWKGETVLIRKIAINDARAQVIFLKSGAANFDLAKPDTTAGTQPQDTGAAPVAIKINDLSIENTRLHYIDHSLDFEITTNGLNWHANGDFADEIFTLKNDLLIDQFSMSYAGMTLLSQAKIDANTDINMDLKKMRFGFADNEFKINALPLQAKGWVEMREKDMDMDIDVRTPSSEFKSLLSVVPGCYTENFADVKASGSLKLVFLMKGIMDDVRMPSTHAEINVTRAGFQYPGMPANASDVSLNFLMDNTDGNPDNTHIVVAPLKAVLGGDPISVELDLKTPVSNPYAKGKVDIDLHLDEWKKLIPLESGTDVAGEVKAHFAFDGHYSAIAKKEFNDLQASGNIALNQIKYNAVGSLPLGMKSLTLSVSPSDFAVVGDGIQYGKSALNLNGKLQNMLGYYLNQETLSGSLIVNSASIDLNEWMGAMAEDASGGAAASNDNGSKAAAEATSAANENKGAAEKSNGATAASAPHIPENLNLMLNMNVGQLMFQDYKFQQATAKVEVAQGKVTVNPLSALFLGSKVELKNMAYSYPLGGKPQFTTDFNILNANPADIANTLSLVKEFAPILGRIQGLANLQTTAGLSFSPTLSPDWGSMTASGLFDLFSGQLDIPTWMSDAAKQLQWGKDAKLALKPTKAGFGIENGKLTLKDSIAVALPKEASMKMGGYMDLNKQLHLGGKMTVKGKSLPFLIEGDVKQPKMSIDWRGAAQQYAKPLVDKAKDKIGNEINKKLDEINRVAGEKVQQLRNAAKQQADQIRQAAKNLANEQRSKTDQAYAMAMDKAKKEADAMVAAAGDPIKKKIARAAADKLLKSAEQKANAARTEGYKLADKTEAEGNAKADKVENEANEKATQIEEAARLEAQKLEKKTTSTLGK